MNPGQFSCNHERILLYIQFSRRGVIILVVLVESIMHVLEIIKIFHKGDRHLASEQMTVQMTRKQFLCNCWDRKESLITWEWVCRTHTFLVFYSFKICHDKSESKQDKPISKKEYLVNAFFIAERMSFYEKPSREGHHEEFKLMGWLSKGK